MLMETVKLLRRQRMITLKAGSGVIFATIRE
jgi:hypothetical protein